MPLGQAPFGSRQTPRGDEPPEDPRARGDRLVSQGRLIFMIGSVVLLAFILARSTGSRASDRTQGGRQGGPCLTDRSCAAGWRCFAIPKDDPFAVEGECQQQCEGDLQCPAAFRCQKVSISRGQVIPHNARGATTEMTGVCQPCGPQGCAP